LRQGPRPDGNIDLGKVESNPRNRTKKAKDNDKNDDVNDGSGIAWPAISLCVPQGLDALGKTIHIKDYKKIP
jgi:hypothetical protein